MNLHYRLIYMLIYLEFILVALIVILTFLLRIFYNYKMMKDQRLTLEATHYFVNLIHSKTKIDKDKFPQYLNKIEILAPVLIKFRKLVDETSWNNVRMDIVRSIMLPLARKATESRNWVKRFFAAETFNSIHTKKDDQLILKLINDDNNLVRNSALTASITMCSEKGIYLIISQIAKENILSQSLYLRAFDNATLQVREIVIKRLKNSTEPYIRATCYAILIKFASNEIAWDVSQDIFSKNLRLMLSAIGFVAYVNREQTIPYLMELIKDSRWQARGIAIYYLGHLRVKTAIPVITSCLKDSNDWVRFVAAEALKNLAIDNINTLVREELGFFDIAQNVLNTI